MFKYQLQRYSGIKSRHHCPQCQHRRKTFTLYIDTETGEPLSPQVGKCGREVKCGYHCTPKQYFNRSVGRIEYGVRKCGIEYGVLRNAIRHGRGGFAIRNTHDAVLLKSTLKSYHQNNLVAYLRSRFGDAVTGMLVARYFIGTAKHWLGATVFWQVDVHGVVRAGKIMLYNPSNGKRIKQPFNHITWVHKALKLPGFELQQCLFGEHLLQGNNMPVAIVESEKTALIASVYMPAFIWLATGSLNNLTVQKCAVLKGRQVHLFPDLNAFEAWRTKAKQLSHLANITVSNVLEQTATPAQREQGWDIADYLATQPPIQ